MEKSINKEIPVETEEERNIRRSFLKSRISNLSISSSFITEKINENENDSKKPLNKIVPLDPISYDIRTFSGNFSFFKYQKFKTLSIEEAKLLQGVLHEP